MRTRRKRARARAACAHLLHPAVHEPWPLFESCCIFYCRSVVGVAASSSFKRGRTRVWRAMCRVPVLVAVCTVLMVAVCKVALADDADVWVTAQGLPTGHNGATLERLRPPAKVQRPHILMVLVDECAKHPPYLLSRRILRAL